jgi:c-di-GMP-binding flagellar brake protein YcgR
MTARGVHMNGLPAVNELLLVRVGRPEVILRSRVHDVAPGFLAIAYPSNGQSDRQLPITTQVTLEWLVARGLCRVGGTVAAYVDVGLPALKIKLDGEPIVYQRREHARADLVLDVDVWTPDADIDDALASGITLDISGGGMRAVLSTELDAHAALVRISLDLPDGKPLDALARVVALRNDGIVAFKFEEIVAGDRERLIRAVFASYRLSAQVRRPS